MHYFYYSRGASPCQEAAAQTQVLDPGVTRSSQYQTAGIRLEDTCLVLRYSSC